MNTIVRSIYSIVIFLALISMFGCATSRIYSGSAMPTDQVAYLERGDIAQILKSVDEKKSINFFLLNSAVEMLLGEHRITVGYGDGSKRGYPYPLTFTAKRGVRYVIKSEFVDSCWKPSIVEKKSQKKVNNDPINLIPMCGYPKIKKPERLRKVDEQFIKTVVEKSGSRKKSSKEFSAWGWAERRKGNMDNAMRRFNQSWLLDPNYYQPYWGFGAITLGKGNPAEASIYFEKALDLIDDAKEKPRLLVDTAKAYAWQGSKARETNAIKSESFNKKANSLIKEALNINPKYGNAYRLLVSAK